ncbi:MAG: phosphocholine cytidylyltransferase family protein [Polyangiaceae bacterium]
MRPVIIGAGRGSRLGPETESIPKTLVPVMGRPMLEWILEALADAGFSKRDVIFISGYAEEVVRERYPDFTYVRNADWENNNILHSLLCAREHLGDGFISTYADIVYDGAIVRALADSPQDIVLGCDTHWRRRYTERSQHPETDAEKLRAEGSRVVELSRNIPSEGAQGEFIGVMKLTPGGARDLISAFDAVAARPPEGVWREGRTFRKAYLIDLLQHMLEAGTEMHRADTPGAYMEIDTLEDLAHAKQWWESR